jgi:hypothetical protein
MEVRVTLGAHVTTAHAGKLTTVLGVITINEPKEEMERKKSKEKSKEKKEIFSAGLWICQSVACQQLQ